MKGKERIGITIEERTREEEDRRRNKEQLGPGNNKRQLQLGLFSG